MSYRSGEPTLRVMPTSLRVITEARACTHCERHLPLGPRPLLAGSRESRVLIIGQAPGKAAHESGIPWHDRSGDRLREWLGVSNEQFYDDRLIALMPMGFCYPGKASSGDAPPRPECAPMWHDKLLSKLASVGLTVYIGHYAFDRYLSGDFGTITEAVAAAPTLLPARIALPHPSPRNNIWLKKHDWFGRDVLPALRARVQALMA